MTRRYVVKGLIEVQQALAGEEYIPFLHPAVFFSFYFP